VTPLGDLLAGTPLPDADGAKTERGTLVVIGGPPSCPGGVLLAGTAALRSGAGRVQLVVHPEVAAAMAVAVPETVVLGWDLERPMPQAVADRLRTAEAVAFGPGCHGGVDAAVDEVAAVVTAPLVIDAGGLDRALALQASNLVLAPNPDEAADMLAADGGGGVEEGADEAALAVALSARVGAPAAVRGATNAVADPNGGYWTSEDAPSGLGTPGSGDVLIGVLTALLAQGLRPLPALGWAITLHAAAGARRAAAAPTGYLARELLTELPVVFAAHRPSDDDRGGEDG
jgi:ADP-dependent NAD(P)H-hydrate dehydratase